MHIPFDQMPLNARVWIYTADRTLTNQDVAILEKEALNFMQMWQSHRAPVKASYSVFYNRFLVIAVDESVNPVGGCSVDSCVKSVVDIGQKIGVDFLCRKSIVQLQQTGQFFAYSNPELKQALENGQVQPSDFIFNPTVYTVVDLKQNWKIPISKSWAAKYILLPQ